MPTVQELSKLMETKSNTDLHDMLVRPADWSEEALQAARNELEKRGHSDLTNPELGAWGSDRPRPQQPKIQLAAPTRFHDCEYCGKTIHSWKLFGDTQKIMIGGKQFHKKCARLYDIAIRIQNISNIITQSQHLEIISAIDNCHLAYRTKYNSSESPREYVGMLVLTNIGVLYLVRDFSLIKKGMSSTGLGAYSGGIAGGLMGAIVDIVQDHYARKKTDVQEMENVNSDILSHHLKAAIDAYLFQPNEIKLMKSTKGLDVMGSNTIVIHTSESKYSFLMSKELMAKFEPIAFNYTRKYLPLLQNSQA